jgi:hypothetical protein
MLRLKTKLRSRLNMFANVDGMVSCRFRATFLSITENYKRVVTLQISTNTAINYTTGYSQLIYLQ